MLASVRAAIISIASRDEVTRSNPRGHGIISPQCPGIGL